MYKTKKENTITHKRREPIWREHKNKTEYTTDRDGNNGDIVSGSTAQDDLGERNKGTKGGRPHEYATNNPQVAVEWGAHEKNKQHTTRDNVGN